MITIEKGRYRTLLKRVFGFVDSENGQELHKVIGSKVSDLGRNLRYLDNADKPMVNAMFEDLQLLHEFFLLETEVEEILVTENTVVQDTTFG